MESFDHIVVGGGVSGMTAALLLARQGFSVALVEAAPRLAPIIRGFKRRGVYFETGMHILGGLGDGHPLHTYFTHLGIMGAIVPRPFNPNGFDKLIFDSSRNSYDIACGFEHFSAQLSRSFPHETEAIKAYASALKQEMDDSPLLNFSHPFDAESLLFAEPTTIAQYLASITDNEELKAVLGYPSIFYGVLPEEALFSNHAMIAGTYVLSAHTLEGGGRSLAKAYEHNLQQSGVTLFCGSKVKRLQTKEKSVTGISLENGQQLKTESCIWTPHPANMLDVVDETLFRPAFKKRVANLESTPSATTLYGISKSRLPMLDNNNVVSLGNESSHSMLAPDTKIEDASFYITTTSSPNSSHSALTVTTPSRIESFPSRGPKYDAYKQELMKRIRHELFCRFPELEGEVEFIDCATPRTLQAYSNAPYGSLYGLKHSVDQFNPAPITKARGLLLAGQSIVAPGILGAVISAYLACGFILGHETLQAELRACT